MADSHTALRKSVQSLFIENFRNKAGRFMAHKGAVIIDDNSAALLASVLQSVKSGADNPADIRRMICENAEHAAFFMDTVHHKTSFKHKKGKDALELQGVFAIKYYITCHDVCQEMIRYYFGQMYCVCAYNSV
jgi:hypothetical protein